MVDVCRLVPHTVAVGQGEPTPGRRAAAVAVRTRRAEKRFSQRDLAEVAGVSRRTISSLESLAEATADPYWPTLESLIAIEQALGWPPGHLLEIAEGPTPTDSWREVRRLLLLALGQDDPVKMRDVIADALVALGPGDHVPG